VPITEHDLLVILPQDIEIALNSSFQVNQHLSDLRPVEPFHAKCIFVVVIDLRSHALIDHADEPGCIFQANDTLQASRKLPDKSARKQIALQRLALLLSCS
jgi:hypothetical protein